MMIKIKEQTTAVHNIEDSHRNYIELKQARHKRLHIVWLCSDEIQEEEKLNNGDLSWNTSHLVEQRG